jgi:hypothetical protein
MFWRHSGRLTNNNNRKKTNNNEKTDVNNSDDGRPDSVDGNGSQSLVTARRRQSAIHVETLRKLLPNVPANDLNTLPIG